VFAYLWLICADGSGLRHIGEPKKGETIFISAASGAVGQIVAQLAKRQGTISVIHLLSSSLELSFGGCG
jgi:NADPH-dependent curcumin reductase CurA